MQQTRRSLAPLSLALTLASLPASVALADTSPPATGPVLYIDANNPVPGANAVLAYRIASDGSLHALPGSPFATGGTGFFDPSYALGPFDNDQNLVFGPNGNTLYAVNPGSDTVAAMRIAPDGSLVSLPQSPFAAQGNTPVSLGVHGDTLLTLDSAEDPSQPGGLPRIAVSKIEADGSLARLPYAAAFLPPGYQPGQVLTTDTADLAITQSFPKDGTIKSFVQFGPSPLIPAATVVPPSFDGTPALPLGLWANPRAPYLYVGFVNVNRVGIYRGDVFGHLDYVGSAANSGQAICWLRISADDRFLYTANTTDQSMSVYDLRNPAAPVEIQHVSDGGVGGYEEFGLTPDGRFLDVLEQENSPAAIGRSNKVHVFAVDRTTGLLTALPQDELTLPVASHTRPIGVAMR